MNVAILVSRLPPEGVGGAERQACQLASRLSPLHRVTVFTRTSSRPPELASSEVVVVRRCSIRARGVRFAADLIQTVIRLGRAKRETDVIIAYQTVIDGLIAVLAKSLYGIPVIVSVRSDTEYLLDKYLQSRLFSPFVYARADYLALQTPRLAEQLIDVFAKAGAAPGPEALRRKLFVLSNGIAEATPRQGSGAGVLYIGQLSVLKGVDVLLQAMRHHPNERLTIIGDGPERPSLEALASGMPNVTFMGMLPYARTQEYLADARMLVLPSRHEGQPNVLMEAMAVGVPVIASRVGGIPDLVTDGETGLLTEPGDALAIARAIQTLSSDAALASRLSANAIRAMRRHAWPVVLQTLEDKLETLRSRRQSSASG